MLFSRKRKRINRARNTRTIAFLLLTIAIALALSACSATKGSIVILESPNGEGFTMDFKEWSSNNKCRLSLNKGDSLQIEIDRKDGEIALTVSGKSGSEPYTGKSLKTGIFTVTVSETDDYEIIVAGENATGKVTVKNLGGAE
ncbi:MAG TPA: hypothetical protein GXZ65_02370 [Clostridiales bacterium]|jgi:hypothetical protein|nr:hypothetical protein [Clostridiales bacterium]